MNPTPLFITNRFTPADDGWFLLVPKGEHTWSSDDGSERFLQIVDDKAVDSIVNRFEANRPAEPMIDADHLSHDHKNKSEAYGWIDNMRRASAGVEAHASWTDLGEPAVKTKRYRFISPAFPRSGIEKLGNGRIRPLEVSDAGLTNQPNMPVPPLTNRAAMDAWLKNSGTSEGARKGWETRRAGAVATKAPVKTIAKSRKPKMTIFEKQDRVRAIGAPKTYEQKQEKDRLARSIKTELRKSGRAKAMARSGKSSAQIVPLDDAR